MSKNNEINIIQEDNFKEIIIEKRWSKWTYKEFWKDYYL
jgi:hypothetical protein